MAVTSAVPGVKAVRPVKYRSMKNDRLWALRLSYVFLAMFAAFFLVPPLYMLITSLKTSQEIGAVTNPWMVYHPTLANYIALLTSSEFVKFFRNSAMVAVLRLTTSTGAAGATLAACANTRVAPGTLIVATTSAMVRSNFSST